jgi:hypothetical protein
MASPRPPSLAQAPYYRLLAEDFGLVRDRRQLWACGYGTSAAMRLLHLAAAHTPSVPGGGQLAGAGAAGGAAPGPGGGGSGGTHLGFPAPGASGLKVPPPGSWG